MASLENFGYVEFSNTELGHLRQRAKVMRIGQRDRL